MQTNPPTIEITPPRVFSLGAVVTVNAYGLLPVGVLFLAILAVSLMKLSIWTVLIPLGMVVGSVWFLPFVLGNTYITRLVRSVSPGADKGGEGFVVQLTLSPRIRSGLRGILEDADDIGYLTFEGAGLRYEGDSVKVFVPYECIEAIRPENIGLRGAYVYGGRIKLLVRGMPETESLEFAERCSWLLPASRRITRQLHAGLMARVGLRTVTGSSVGPPP